jgi:predicted DNA-binding ribbon-helix-helix protein
VIVSVKAMAQARSGYSQLWNLLIIRLHAFKDIAASRRTTLSDLIGSIDHERKRGNLSSALRLFVLNHYQARAA